MEEKKPVEKSFWSKLVETIAPMLVSAATSAALKNVFGFRLVVLKLLYKYGGKKLLKILVNWADEIDEAIKNGKITDEYQEIVVRPDETREERKNGEGNFINGGQ